MVPCWTINGEAATRGIRLHGDPPSAILVGEAGRGRSLTTVPIPDGATVRDGVLTHAPTSYAGGVAVVLIRDQSGFRGWWRLTEAATAFCPDGDLDSPVVGVRQCPSCGGEGYHNLTVDGRPLRAIEPTALGKVVAAGRCAQGIAGRAGGGPEYLVIVRPCRFGIFRGGRLYGQPAWLTVTITDDGTVAVTPTVAALKTQAAAAAW